MPHDDLQSNTGKVLTDQHVALYRDRGGGFHALSSVCTHMGCDVGWDDRDKVWACPCHSSRFAPAGDIIHGPAVKPLRPVANASSLALIAAKRPLAGGST
jgi:Rieske Fe-S protein